jgi:hypothetical protein
MKLEAAIKKIRNRAKAVNREVQIEQRDHHNNGRPKVYVHFEDAVSELSFWTNSDGTIGAPHIRRFNDHSDPYTDYFAGYHLDNITQALNTLAPLPPKYPVGSLVRFKDNKRMKRHKLAGIVALVVEASHGGHYKLQWAGSEHRYDPSYAERDIEKIS